MKVKGVAKYMVRVQPLCRCLYGRGYFSFFKFLVDKLRRSDLLVVRQQNDNHSPVWGDM